MRHLKNNLDIYSYSPVFKCRFLTKFVEVLKYWMDFNWKITVNYCNFEKKKKKKKKSMVFVPYMDSALNMDTPNIFESNKFYRHIAL